MRKNFKLKIVNKKDANQADSIKYEVRKYIARERRKQLPKGADFWDFDCRVGDNEQTAPVVHLSKINKTITDLSSQGKDSCYIEILARPAQRTKKEKTDKVSTDD